MTDTETGAAAQRPTANHWDERPELLIGLQAAVQLVILEIAGWTPEQRTGLAPEWGQVVAAHGDDLLYGGRHCKEAFNALAKGLGAGAYQPGGVTFAGLHWCVGSHHNGTRDEAPCDAEIAREAAEPNHDKESEAHP